VSISINRNADSTLTQMRSTIDFWTAEARAAHVHDGDFEVFAADAQFYLIEVTLAAESDADKREALQRIPTSLELPADDVALLRAHARAALQRSGEFSGCCGTCASSDQGRDEAATSSYRPLLVSRSYKPAR